MERRVYRSKKRDDNPIDQRARYRIGRLLGWRFSGNMTRAAAEMGVGYYKLYRALNDGGPLSLEMIERIATFFGMTLDELLAPDNEGITRKEEELAT